eukprot:29717-Chlamydomonas_euryale.AAC.8
MEAPLLWRMLSWMPCCCCQWEPLLPEAYAVSTKATSSNGCGAAACSGGASSKFMRARSHLRFCQRVHVARSGSRGSKLVTPARLQPSQLSRAAATPVTRCGTARRGAAQHSATPASCSRRRLQLS